MLSRLHFGACLVLAVASFGCDAFDMPETVRNPDDPTLDRPTAAPTAGTTAGPTDTAADDTAAGAVARRPQVRLIKIDGTVSVNGEPGVVGAEVPRDATIEAGKNGHAILTIGGTSVIEIRSKTKVTLGKSKRAEWSLKLLLGTLWSFIDSGVQYEVITDNAVAGVRGTAFFVQAKKKGKTYVCACHGNLQITAKNKKSFDKLVSSPAENHKSFNITSKGKRQKVKKAKRIGHTDEQKMAIMEAQKLL